jgi:hypothetical protein
LLGKETALGRGRARQSVETGWEREDSAEQQRTSACRHSLAAGGSDGARVRVCGTEIQRSERERAERLRDRCGGSREEGARVGVELQGEAL